MGFLSRLVSDLRRDLLERAPPEALLRARLRTAPPARPFGAALHGQAIALIAEVKRASPSAGAIADADAGRQAERYEAAGAAAISVLTEPRHFAGSLADLRLARAATALPVLRKDFLVHPAQVVESRVEGADAVLLIAAALPGLELLDLVETAADSGLDALVEVHTEEELSRAIDAGAALIGVNARDLETLRVDFDAALALAAAVPADRTVVVESGIASRDDVRRAEEAGASAVLVGEALMRAPDPRAAAAALLGRTGTAPAGP